MRHRKRLPWLVSRGGVWYVYWYENGRTKRRSCGTHDRVEALRMAVEKAGGRVIPPSRKLDAADPWRSMAKRMCKRARENAKVKNRAYSISPDLVLKLMSEQYHRCAVTGIDLQLPTQARDPWAPSIDQVLPGQGYTEQNVRIVSTIVNTAMNWWGEAVFLELVSKMRLAQRGAGKLVAFTECDTCNTT